MSGGGNYVSRGAMRLSDSSNSNDQAITADELEK